MQKSEEQNNSRMKCSDFCIHLHSSQMKCSNRSRASRLSYSPFIGPSTAASFLYTALAAAQFLRPSKRLAA